MADILNMSELGREISEKLFSSISPLVTIFEVVGIALLVYIIFLVIKALFRWRAVSKIGKIAKSVEQINEKLDVLIKESGQDKGKPEKEKIKKEEIKKKKGKK